MKKLNQQGFHLWLVGVAIVVIAVVGFGAYRVWNANKNDTKGKEAPNSQTTNSTSESTPKPTANEPVLWQWNDKEWQPNGTAPKCEAPIQFSVAPSDLSKATSVLYPGQVRGGNYKPHGGIGFSGETNDIAVKAIMDGWVTSGSRYLEGGETQYMFWIQNACGIAYRFDHLLKLSPTFQAIADTLPAAKQDDSRTTNFEKPTYVKAGDTVATAIGFPKTKNAAYDLGVYDLRKPNAKGSDAAYREAHKTELSQAAYAVCWFNMFSEADSTRLLSLPSRDAAQGKTSDYCN